MHKQGHRLSVQEGTLCKPPTSRAEVERGARTLLGSEWGCLTGTQLPASTLGSCQIPQVLLLPLLSHKNKDVASAPWLGWSWNALPLPLPFPPQGAGRQAGRRGWAGSTGHAAPACGDSPRSPCLQPWALSPGKSTSDQGCEAQAGRLGRNFRPPQCPPGILPI